MSISIRDLLWTHAVHTLTQRHSHTLLFPYLQKAGKLDNPPAKAFGFWFNQTHLVYVYSEEPLGLAALFTHHHAGYEVTVI